MNTERASPSRAEERSANETSVDDLIVVSNRQPYRHDYERTDDGRRIVVDRPAGGLTAGLDPVLQRIDGTWIAWGDGDADADVVDGDDCVRVPPDDEAYSLRRLWLTDEQVENYYYGYSNQVLWPLCHGFPDKVVLNEAFWDQYEQVNDAFADAVVDHATGDSLVWFQDYHLALAPREVRARMGAESDAFLMQFWHIPWPAWDTFRVCPQRQSLLEGVLGNDLFGFHTDRDCEQFLRCVDAGLDDAEIDWERSRVRYDGRWTAVRAFPMGVDADRIECVSESADATASWREFEREHGLDDVRVGVGVDRLDYTKGIVERLEALERLWETRPRWQGEFTYVQKGTESRSRIPAYRELQADVEAAVERINDRFETDDWQPVVYVEERLSETELYGLYRHGDLAIVSSVRDGMNLVAKEYVAAQTGRAGVLVLSSMTGAHEQLGSHAVTVNPRDTPSFADGIHAALTMDEDERRSRMRVLRDRVASADLEAWADDALRTAQALRRRADGERSDER